jgi:hypothetical protein
MLRTVAFTRIGRKCGFGLIEVVAASGIISMVILSVSLFFQKTLELSKFAQDTVQANYLLEEGVDIVQAERSERWSTDLGGLGVGSLVSGTDYYTDFLSSGFWGISATPEMLAGRFERKVAVGNVSRDPVTRNIEAIYNVANNDPDTRKVTVSVGWWTKAGTTTKSITTYVTNLFLLP